MCTIFTTYTHYTPVFIAVTILQTCRDSMATIEDNKWNCDNKGHRYTPEY